MKYRINDAEHAALDASRQADYVRDGHGWRLDVEPEDTTGLKNAFAATKAENARLREELAAAIADREAGSGDNTASIELLEKRLAEIEARVAAQQADFEATTAAREAEQIKALAERTAEIEKHECKSDTAVLDYEVDREIRAAHGYPELLADRVKRLVKVVRDENARHGRVVVAVDDAGEIMLDPTGAPLTLARTIQELKLFDPALAVAFEPSGNGNGNGGAPRA